MSFPAYESYKESGVEWLRRVPAHWIVDRFKASVLDCRNGLWGEEADGGPNDILCIRVADFDRIGLGVSLARPTFRKTTAQERSDRLVQPGDLLLEKSGGGEKQPVGAVVRYDQSEPAICSNFVARMRLKPAMSSKFWCYVHAAAYSIRLTVGSINQTSGIQNLDQSRYFDELAPFPPLSEQDAIAAFLDRETAKIDALVEAQRRLIELLKEKRQAVISHAVTKGLDPSAPMKDSGVEWLGQVPAHWEVVPLKRYLDVLSGYAFPSTGFSDNPADVPLLRGVNVGVGRIRWDDTVYWRPSEDDRLEAWNLAAGDIVIGMDRPWIAEGLRLAEVAVEDLPCLLLQRVAALRPTPAIRTEYLKLFLQGEAFYHHCVPEMTGVSVPHISPGQICEFRVAIPPLDEQLRIAVLLQSATVDAEALTVASEQAISLLQERRAALISAAVTGKIDVRDLAQTAEAA